jgi:undecaprenyl-diphosphatase
MTVLAAAILGLVQGLTEFLPVSSSGHLVLAGALIGIPEGNLSFDIVLHLGSLAAVLAIYRRDILDLLSGICAGRREDLTLAGLLILGSVPAGIAGFLLADRIESLFNSPAVVSGMLLFTGCVLFATRFARAGKDENPTLPGSLVIGLFQAIALVPGISRSGMTISAGLYVGVRRERAARFSFLLSVPAILGAALLELTGSGGLVSLDFSTAAIGFVVSAVTGYVALRILIRFLAAGRFHLFCWYCWALGGLGLALTLGRG